MFKIARLKLTGWYLLMIVFVSLTFSSVIYQGMTVELDRFANLQRTRVERRLQDEFVDNWRQPPTNVFIDNPELVLEFKSRLLTFLVEVNGVILGLAGVLGYFLAGKTLKPIEDMVEEQNRFITDSSHELRTPLTSLKTALEVGTRDKKMKLNEAKILIKESIAEVERLQSLSEGLLRLAQYHKGEKRASFARVSLSYLVSRAIKRVGLIANKKEIEVVNRTMEMEFEVNEEAIEDLLVILLDNAIKYSDKKKKVILISEVVGRKLYLKIRDEGIGISENDLPHVFDRFYRADKSRVKTNGDGYGLGLAIAKRIVETHGGEIKVKSELDKGSEFIVCLPLEQKSNSV